jgi:small subunit ribosomal protein S17
MEKTEQKAKRIYVGEVVSDKMDKTIVVKTVRSVKHPQLGKILRKFKKYSVHDELEQAKIGDTIEFYEGAPKSKTKYMYLARIITSQEA